MANDTQWNPIQFNPVRIDPSQGFAAASKSFEGINRVIDNNKRAESLAAYRDANTLLEQQKQSYIEDAPQRAILEENRLNAIEQEKVRIAAGNAQAASYGGAQRFDSPGVLKLLENNPAYMALSEDQRIDGRNKFILSNTGVAGGADPTAMTQRFVDSMVASGKFSQKEIDTRKAAFVKNQAPTMPFEQQKAIMNFMKPAARGTQIFNGSGGSGRSSGGSFKAVYGEGDSGTRNQNVDRLVENYDLDKSVGWAEQVFRFAKFAAVPSRGELDQVMGMLAQNGAIDGDAAATILTQSFNNNGSLKDEYNWTKPGEEGVKARAKLNALAAQAQEAANLTRNTKTGQILGNSSSTQVNGQANQGKIVSEILARGKSKRLTDQQLVNSYLASFGIEPNKPAAVANKIAPVATPVVTPPPAAVPAPVQSEIMPGAIMPVPEGNTDPILANLNNMGTGNINTILPEAQKNNSLGITLKDIPESEGSKLLDTIIGTAKEIPGVIERASTRLNNLKNESYAKNTKTVVDAIKATGNLDGVSGSDIRIALTSKSLTPEEKEIIRKLNKIRKR